MLYNVSNTWNCGFMEDYTAYSENGFSINSTNIKTSTVQVHKYQIESLIPPSIINTLSGKYIVPGWIPVPMETEYKDIEWVKPVSNQVKEENTWSFSSANLVIAALMLKRETG